MKLITKLAQRNWQYHQVLLIGFVGIIVTGLTDYLTGYELGFSIFYVLPLAFIVWFGSRNLGLVAAVISAVLWLTVDIASGHVYSHPLIPIWNAFIRGGFFVLIVVLLSEIKIAHEKERKLARFDNLTGAVNARYFYELLTIEIERSERYRHPFSIAYIDLDNFKQVNDQNGHLVGDRVLQTVVQTAQSHLRKTDIVGRLGGDEFVLLLPETDQPQAQAVMSKLREQLLSAMQSADWPVTFSIGVITCQKPPTHPQLLLKAADALMYQVKHHAKNDIRYDYFPPVP
jgi:diguanylate cyclase (GGDEF)-like protein